MVWLAFALTLFLAAFVCISWLRRRRRREVSLVVPLDLVPRIQAATRALVAAESWRPASDPRAPPAGAAIESALIANERRRALEAAELALAADPDGAASRVWLAWALCASSQPTAALDQLALARARSREADTVDGPLAAYLAARAEHLRFEHAAGASGAMPSLVTTADLAVVTLASGRGAATWLTGTTDVQLSAIQVRAAIAEHREVTARCLAQALSALEAAPGFIDAAYLVARLSVKAGLLASARALFDAIAPRIDGCPDADAFERDRKDLADPANAVAHAKSAPIGGTAKRSRSLKVI